MEDLPTQAVTAASRRALTALIVALAVTVVSCGTTTGGVAVTAPATSAPALNPALLDAGHYPVTPQPALGNAGSEEAGRLVEGRRLASYVIGPWQVDPALTARLNSDVAVMDSYKTMGESLLWPPVAAAAVALPFLDGFMSQRHAADGPPKSLRNAVLRFADPGAAVSAAQGFFDHAMGLPLRVDIVPIVTEPQQALAIPGHPDAKAALLTFQEVAGSDTVQELTVATPHGPYVLVQVVRCTAGPDCMTQLAAHTLDLQLPLIDTFTPADPADFAALPLDPTGLVARTLPLPDHEITTTSGAAYTPAGALHFEDNPVTVGPALTSAGVDYASMGRTTIYQAKTPADADKLVEDYAGIVATMPAAQSAAAVPGLPQSHCTLVPGSGGLIPHHWCLAAAGRYMIKAVSRQLDNAHQLVAAQYRMLGS